MSDARRREEDEIIHEILASLDKRMVADEEYISFDWGRWRYVFTRTTMQ